MDTKTLQRQPPNAKTKTKMDVEIKGKTRQKKSHLNDCWISSNVFPFVSGTQIATNATVSMHMAV